MSQITSIVFAGTPDFAVPQLKKLHETGCRILGVWTQPDRPKGRGRELSPSPIKLASQTIGVPCWTPDRLSADFLDQLPHERPDFLVVAAYGLLLPQAILDYPRKACINVHASLLPRWRGASPVQAAIAAGDKKTGVCIMQMELGLDTGPVYLKDQCEIESNDTTETLMERLSVLGSDALIECLRNFDERVPQKQKGETTYAPRIKKQQGQINWHTCASVIERKIRAYQPWPGSFTFINGQRILIHQASVLHETTFQGRPGEIRLENDKMMVRCSPGVLCIDRLQFPGKKITEATAYKKQIACWVGDAFESVETQL